MSNEERHADWADDEFRRAMEEGANYYRLEQFEKALEIFEKTIQFRPNDPAAYVGKGNCLRKLKLYQPAINFYEQATHVDPINISAYIGICYSYIKFEDYETALLAYEIAISLDPNNATAQNCRGMIYRLQGQYEESLRSFEEAIRLYKAGDNLAGFYFNRGLTLCDLRRYGEALDAYEHAILLEPEKTKYLNEKTQLIARLEALGGPSNKRSNNVSRLRPPYFKVADMSYKRTLLKQGDAHYQAKKYWEALNAYSRAIREDSKDADAYVRKGNCLRELKIYQEALQCYDRAIALNSQMATAFIGKADVYKSCGEFENALALYIEAGKTLLSQGFYEQALESFDKALQLNPQLAQAHAGRGHALLALNRSMDSLKSYGEAIDLHTDDVHCYINSAEILMTLDGYREAIRLYEQALQLAPELVAAHAGRANALFELKRYQESLLAYQQVVILDPGNDVAHMSIGDIQTILKNDAGAADSYGKALELVEDEQHPDRLWLLAT